MNVVCPPIAAFNAYLGNDKESWPKYDATELAKSYDGPKLPPILIDQVICLTVIQLNENWHCSALPDGGQPPTKEQQRHQASAHKISPASAYLQGSSDNFLEKDLTPDRLVAAAKSNSKLEVNLRMQQVQL
jgi:S-formylglutathione hydrolase FrmB